MEDRLTDENGVKNDSGEVSDVGYCNTIQNARNNRCEQPRIPAAVRGERERKNNKGCPGSARWWLWLDNCDKIKNKERTYARLAFFRRWGALC